jgi:hypothetical protein
MFAMLRRSTPLFAESLPGGLPVLLPSLTTLGASAMYRGASDRRGSSTLEADGSVLICGGGSVVQVPPEPGGVGVEESAGPGAAPGARARVADSSWAQPPHDLLSWLVKPVRASELYRALFADDVDADEMEVVWVRSVSRSNPAHNQLCSGDDWMSDEA